MQPIIRVDRVSKQYFLGRSISGATSIREILTSVVSSASRHQAHQQAGEPKSLWALKDVSFDVNPGEILGIIGRNGAGKSTLLKILSRITKPTTGKIELKGRVGSLLEVGTGFNPELTGRENVYLNGAIHGMRRKEISQKFDEIVQFAEVERFIDSPVKYYSSGMYMRLAFGVAAHLDPEILVVDEVLAVGDYSFQKKCLGKMSNVAKQGRTILFVSHNLLALRSLCTRAVLIEQGALVMSGSPGDVVSRYVQSNALASHKKIWTGTLDTTCQITPISIELSTIQNGNLSQLTVDDSFQILFEYSNSIPDSVLQVSLVLYNLEGVCIFNCRSTPKMFPAGIIQQGCTIPGGFLNDDTYTVRIVVVRDTNNGLFDESNVLTFEVHDTERPGGWFGKWMGVTRPSFVWTDFVHHHDNS